MSLKKIVVYADAKASTEIIPRLRESFHYVSIKKARADQLQSRLQLLDNNTLAFVLPGIIGEDSLYRQQLGEQGNDKIRRYVKEGGVFIGVCAGAYYSSRDVLFDPPWRDTPKTSQPGLNFFNGLARGPILNKGRNDYSKWFSDCMVTEISYFQNNSLKKTGVAYGNGPALYPAGDEDRDLEVLARYEDVDGNPIAIAAKQIGRGLAVFIGVLPHIGYDAQSDFLKFPELQSFMQDLKYNEQGRSAVWDMVISRVKRHYVDSGGAHCIKIHP